MFYGSTVQNLTLVISSYKRNYKAFLNNKNEVKTFVQISDKMN